MRYPFFVAITCLLTAGCVGNDVLVQRQASLENRLEQLAQSHKMTAGRLAELESELAGLQERLKKSDAEQVALRPLHLDLQAELTRLSQKLDRIETELPPPQATRIEVVNRDAAAEGREGRAQDAYLKAFGLFSANNYPAAAEAFAAFIRTYPESEHAGNAQYWLGECYYSDGRYHLAIEAFTRVANGSLQGPKVPDAILKIGLSWFSLNDPVKGRYVLLSLIEKFPASEAAAKARDKVGQK